LEAFRILKNRRVFSASPFFDEQSIEAISSEVAQTLRSGVLADGPRVNEFERQIAEYVQTKHAVAVSSGTAALEIMLRFFGVENKEVIVPTNTFVATPTSVLLSGGKPVFVDMKAETLCIDIDEISKKLTSKTAGLIVVHIAGLVCPEMGELRKFCQDNKLFLIEDAAHALSAKIDGQMAGSLCGGGAFSFYPTKIVTTGQGGMITTDDSALASAAYSMRNHGLDSERIMTMLGDNWCMSEVTAVIGKYQLAHIEDFVQKRNALAKYYENRLKDRDNISIFKTPSNIRHSYYKYPIRINEKIDRDKVASKMKTEFGIDTGSIYYPPCHLHPWYKENFGTGEGDFPVSETVLKKVLCLPMHIGITEETAQYIIDSLDVCISKST
jgi:perosamine synthetase